MSARATPQTPARPKSSTLYLLTGGARSGKSAYAEKLAAHLEAKGRRGVLYLATLEAKDPEMAARVRLHLARRPEHWRTVLEPLKAGEAIKQAPEEVVLLDCFSGLVANLLLSSEGLGSEGLGPARLQALCQDILEATRSTHKTLIIVTNEVGSGVVPPTPLGRNFRDALGYANTALAKEADAAALFVMGLRQPLKGAFPEGV